MRSTHRHPKRSGVVLIGLLLVGAGLALAAAVLAGGAGTERQIAAHRAAAAALRSAERAQIEGQATASADAARECLALLAATGDATDPAPLRARAHELLADHHAARGEPALAREQLAAALAAYREAGIATAVERIRARLGTGDRVATGRAP